MVDIWFDPQTKDHNGWRGPGTVSSVTASEGHVTVRMQGRTIGRQTSEIREHIPYVIFAGAYFDDHGDHLLHLQHLTTQMHHSTIRHYGIQLTKSGWRSTSVTATEVGHQDEYLLGESIGMQS